jgi:hypothetical protein
MSSNKEIEYRLIQVITNSFYNLERLGWKHMMYAQQLKPNTPIQVIELGSTGIHSATKDEEGRYWVTDDEDTYPSHPIMWRKVDG